MAMEDNVDMDRAYGQQARFGFIHPGGIIEATAYQFYRMAPPGFTIAATLLGLRELTFEEVDRVRAMLEESARSLASSNVNAIVQSGVPIVVSRQPGYEVELAEQLTRAGGVPATTDVLCTMKALRHLGATRIAVATPFSRPINERVEAFFQGSGFEVAAIGSLLDRKDISPTQPITKTLALLPPQEAFDTALEIYKRAGSADAIYIGGAPWPCVEAIAPLERETGRPVVASMQAMLWGAMQLAGLKVPIQGFGVLLERPQ